MQASTVREAGPKKRAHDALVERHMREHGVPKSRAMEAVRVQNPGLAKQVADEEAAALAGA